MASTPRSRGRPRSDASRAAILRAAFAVLCERGYDAMAIEAVAARGGVGKTTIYRWWPNQAALAVEAFFEATNEELSFPETGSTREDFRQQIHQLARLLSGPAGTALAAMMVGARTDPVLNLAIVQRWVLPRKRWGQEKMRAAQERGEVAATLNIESALDALYGPLYARLFVGLGAHSATEVDGYLEIVLGGIFRPVG